VFNFLLILPPEGDESTSFRARSLHPRVSQFLSFGRRDFLTIYSCLHLSVRSLLILVPWSTTVDQSKGNQMSHYHLHYLKTVFSYQITSAVVDKYQLIIDDSNSSLIVIAQKSYCNNDKVPNCTHCTSYDSRK